ncbi:MAG: 2-amino-4-hydroxy-6-hydroxymethyldihydropteridine diphosphokinase [Lachnospiraceae bacterium]|jgi:dihydroneopterin aldolase/2-amino-4-hydroxy-6-hydroxymethyldihydropteridine diphosphokinase|nr:2-amino-4-hydroxy-6-hydroxymethyldihydropteridine diphosphokinase [Lachnospiraceae bacterium]
MDHIFIKNLKIFANHGVYEEETRKGQDFYVNARLYLDLRTAGKTDSLERSVNYGEVCLFLKDFLTKHTYQLIEAASYHSMKALLLKFPLIRRIEFELCKPEAPIPMEFENVSTVMQMGWHKVYIALGSNMGDRRRTILTAVEALEKDDDFRKIRTSSLIETKPYGGVEQDDFLNGVLEAQTILTPQELLDRLHFYEAKAGRKRAVHWGPRTLDLDILFYDDLILSEEDLIIPHPDMGNREFVLKPLLELAPCLRHPVYQKTTQQLYEMISGSKV